VEIRAEVLRIFDFQVSSFPVELSGTDAFSALFFVCSLVTHSCSRLGVSDWDLEEPVMHAFLAVLPLVFLLFFSVKGMMMDENIIFRVSIPWHLPFFLD